MSRIILKISGGILKSDECVVDKNNLNIIYNCVNLLINDGHSVGIVVGGGNFFRGREHTEMNKVTADTIGMLGTVMNALYIKDYLEKENMKCLVTTPFSFPALLDNYTNAELKTEYEKGNIIIFGGGVGKSGYSTDSGTIRARDIVDSDLIIKLTNVDGVYTSDPNKDKRARKLEKLSYDEVIKHNYEVMDMYAIEECKKKNTKILVMNFYEYEHILEYFKGCVVGTIIGGENE